MTEGTMRGALAVLGVGQLALFAWMAISPDSFFDTVAGFGEPNDHYIRDASTFPLAIGVGLLAAVGRTSWRVPVLAVAAVWYLAHSVNHLIDIGEADPAWVGPADFAALLVTGLVLAYLAFAAASDDFERSGRSGSGTRGR